MPDSQSNTLPAASPCQKEMIGPCTLYYGQVETVLPLLSDASVQLIIADPPYYKTKLFYEKQRVEWDRRWQSREAYLDWLRQLAKEWRRVLTPNGSLYCFASPAMAAWAEVTLSESFHILQRLTWRKPMYSTKAEMFDKESCRMFFPASEAIIFAEQYGSDRPFDDALICEQDTYWTACQTLKRSLFASLIAEAMSGTKTTAKEVTEAIGAYGKVNHGGAVSNWLLGHNIPTKAQYEAMRMFFNSRNCRHDYLRKDYEDLRKDYEDLRRPFTVSAAVPYTDVWDFHTVAAAAGKHPCEKPVPMLRHIIEASSRPGDVVLDCFSGSGSTLEAAQQCGRQAIGIEQDRHWWKAAATRLRQLDMFTLFTAPAQKVGVS